MATEILCGMDAASLALMASSFTPEQLKKFSSDKNSVADDAAYSVEGSPNAAAHVGSVGALVNEQLGGKRLERLDTTDEARVHDGVGNGFTQNEFHVNCNRNRERVVLDGKGHTDDLLAVLKTAAELREFAVKIMKSAEGDVRTMGTVSAFAEMLSDFAVTHGPGVNIQGVVNRLEKYLQMCSAGAVCVAGTTAPVRVELKTQAEYLKGGSECRPLVFEAGWTAEEIETYIMICLDESLLEWVDPANNNRQPIGATKMIPGSFGRSIVVIADEATLQRINFVPSGTLITAVRLEKVCRRVSKLLNSAHTSIAMNCAAALCHETHAPCVLVDADRGGATDFNAAAAADEGVQMMRLQDHERDANGVFMPNGVPYVEPNGGIDARTGYTWFSIEARKQVVEILDTTVVNLGDYKFCEMMPRYMCAVYRGGACRIMRAADVAAYGGGHVAVHEHMQPPDIVVVGAVPAGPLFAAAGGTPFLYAAGVLPPVGRISVPVTGGQVMFFLPDDPVVMVPDTVMVPLAAGASMVSDALYPRLRGRMLGMLLEHDGEVAPVVHNAVVPPLADCNLNVYGASYRQRQATIEFTYLGAFALAAGLVKSPGRYCSARKNQLATVSDYNFRMASEMHHVLAFLQNALIGNTSELERQCISPEGLAAMLPVHMYSGVNPDGWDSGDYMARNFICVSDSFMRRGDADMLSGCHPGGSGARRKLVEVGKVKHLTLAMDDRAIDEAKARLALRNMEMISFMQSDVKPCFAMMAAPDYTRARFGILTPFTRRGITQVQQSVFSAFDAMSGPDCNTNHITLFQ